MPAAAEARPCSTSLQRRFSVVRCVRVRGNTAWIHSRSNVEREGETVLKRLRHAVRKTVKNREMVGGTFFLTTQLSQTYLVLLFLESACALPEFAPYKIKYRKANHRRRCSLLFHAAHRPSCIVQPKFRKVLTQQDANGMTFLHHAINANSDELVNPATGVRVTRGTPRTSPPPLPTDRPATSAQGARLPPDQASPDATADRGPLDAWVPLVKSALKFAKSSLWAPEVCVCLAARLQL